MKSSKHFVRFQMAVIESWLVKQCLQCKWSIIIFFLSYPPIIMKLQIYWLGRKYRLWNSQMREE